MNAKTIHRALKGEFRLRNFAAKISEGNTDVSNLDAFKSENSAGVQCSKSGLIGLSKKINYSLRGKSEVARKRQIFIRLLFVSTYWVLGYFFGKKKCPEEFVKESYLVYPSLADPKFLINFSDKALLSHLPLIFSSNELLNKIHLWMLIAINRYSASISKRNRAVIRTGVGLVTLEESKAKTRLLKPFDSISDRYSALIILSEEKSIYFFSVRKKSVSKVIIWDAEIATPRLNDMHLDSPFETHLYTGILGGRKLKVTNYYEGEPLRFSMTNFIAAVDKLLDIQAKSPTDELYSCEHILKSLNDNQWRLGLSSIDVQEMERRFNWLFSKRRDLFRLKYQHGDFVPSNIISQKTKEMSFIDSSDDTKKGFFLTDISTLVVAFLAGEPKRSDSRRLEKRIGLSNFMKMKNHIESRLNLTEEELMTAFIIGLLEKVRLCEIEKRKDVKDYWTRVTGAFYRSYCAYGESRFMGKKDVS
ncbi:hypothetical protein N9854_04115 [Amylibacter sp.]|nr:hypothetical protein [Amylibacter sp.]